MAFCAIKFPVFTEPVKEIASISFDSVSVSPAILPGPCTQLRTPFGKPLRCTISAKAIALAGTISEGFSTTQLPKAKAGAIFQAATAMGKFQGVITPITPRGSLVTSTFTLDRVEVTNSPIMRAPEAEPETAVEIEIAASVRNWYSNFSKL